MQRAEEKDTKFALGLCGYKYFFVFITICLLGYLYESVLSFFQLGHFASRQGLLWGPFIPVYGCGAVLFMQVMRKVQHPLWLFVTTGIVGAVFEFLYSFIQEQLFGTISWEYHEYFMNFQGRTSLVHGIFWGVLGVVFVKLVYPFLSKQIEKIPKKIGIVLSWILIVFMLFNVTFSVVASLRQKERVMKQPRQDITDEFMDTHFPDRILDETYSNHKRVKEGLP